MFCCATMSRTSCTGPVHPLCRSCAASVPQFDESTQKSGPAIKAVLRTFQGYPCVGLNILYPAHIVNDTGYSLFLASPPPPPYRETERGPKSDLRRLEGDRRRLKG